MQYYIVNNVTCDIYVCYTMVQHMLHSAGHASTDKSTLANIADIW